MAEYISYQGIGIKISGNEEVIKDVVESLKEVYAESGTDMPKQLHDAVFSFETQLGVI
jgi:hypothetical protein